MHHLVGEDDLTPQRAQPVERWAVDEHGVRGSFLGSDGHGSSVRQALGVFPVEQTGQGLGVRRNHKASAASVALAQALPQALSTVAAEGWQSSASCSTRLRSEGGPVTWQRLEFSIT